MRRYSYRALYLLRCKTLQRALIGQNHHLYKLSISIIILIWGFIFLLSLWITRSDGYRDTSDVHTSRKMPLLFDAFKLGSINLSTCPVDRYEVAGSSCTGYPNQSSADDNLVKSEELQSKNEVRSQPLDEVTSTAQLGYARAAEENTSLSTSAAASGTDTQKNDRTNRSGIVPIGLDEFKNKAIGSKNQDDPTGLARKGVRHRLETDGADYNYASSSKGAKVLASNKEAKGASNILNKDKDKYLRNPCSARDKFVVVELSEETLVDMIVIANFEHHSSNLKDFELLGSLVYPTETWVMLANITAGNVKQVQKFPLSDEPKWVRYLKLNLLNHYGSEFYCTLSAIEVYGVDAIERMLEDLVDNQQQAAPASSSGEPMMNQHEYHNNIFPDEAKTLDNEDHQNYESPQVDSKPGVSSSTSFDSVVDDNDVLDPTKEIRRQKFSSRIPSDSVLKILMQKVRALNLNLSVLEKYLEELNTRYGTIFRELDNEMEGKDLILKKIRSDIDSLLHRKEIIAEDLRDLISWKSIVSMQMDSIHRNNAILRSEVRNVRESQMYMENKGVTICVISFIFCIIALIMLCVNIYTILGSTDKPRKFCPISSSWIFLLLSSSATFIIISL